MVRKTPEYPEDANGYLLKAGDMVSLNGRPWMVEGPGRRFGTFMAVNLRTGKSIEVKGYDCEHIANGSITKNIGVGPKGCTKREFL